MKTILLGITIIFLTVTVFSQKKQTDLEFERIKGQVKSVQGSSMYLGTKKKPEKSPKRRYGDLIYYGLDGNISESINSELGTKYVYQFVDGFLSMKEVVVDKQKAANIMRSKSIGNAQNMEKPVKTIKSDERFISRFDDEYDDNKRRKLRRIFSSDGLMNSIMSFNYNAANLLKNEIDKGFGSKWSYSYDYDENGNQMEQTMKRSSGNDVIDLTTHTEYSNYKFDAQGNWVERKYKYQEKYNDTSKISEGIEYQEINYYEATKQ